MVFDLVFIDGVDRLGDLFAPVSALRQTLLEP